MAGTVPRAGLRYRERLGVPVRWWLLAGGFVLSVLLAYAVAVPGVVALSVAGVVGAVAVALLAGYGRVRVEVSDAGLAAGRGRLPLWAVGEVTALGREAAAAARGRDADVRSYLVLRGYLPGAVKVVVADPADPVPYWLVSSRHPQELAAALVAARDASRGAGG